MRSQNNELTKKIAGDIKRKKIIQTSIKMDISLEDMKIIIEGLTGVIEEGVEEGIEGVEGIEDEGILVTRVIIIKSTRKLMRIIMKIKTIMKIGSQIF